MFKPSLSKDLPFTSYPIFNFKKLVKVKLTGIERGRILELRKQNLPQRVIAGEICRNKTVIANFLKDPDEYETIKHTSLPEKSSLALGMEV